MAGQGYNHKNHNMMSERPKNKHAIPTKERRNWPAYPAAILQDASSKLLDLVGLSNESLCLAKVHTYHVKLLCIAHIAIVISDGKWSTPVDNKMPHT